MNEIQKIIISGLLLRLLYINVTCPCPIHLSCHLEEVGVLTGLFVGTVLIINKDYLFSLKN